MDRWGPKHVELTYVMNKTHSLKRFVYLVGLHIYYKYKQVKEIQMKSVCFSSHCLVRGADYFPDRFYIPDIGLG